MLLKFFRQYVKFGKFVLTYFQILSLALSSLLISPSKEFFIAVSVFDL